VIKFLQTAENSAFAMNCGLEGRLRHDYLGVTEGTAPFVPAYGSRPAARCPQAAPPAVEARGHDIGLAQAAANDRRLTLPAPRRSSAFHQAGGRRGRGSFFLGEQPCHSSSTSEPVAK
jgi:hypothetical protein